MFWAVGIACAKALRQERASMCLEDRLEEEVGMAPSKKAALYP